MDLTLTKNHSGGKPELIKNDPMDEENKYYILHKFQKLIQNHINIIIVSRSIDTFLSKYFLSIITDWNNQNNEKYILNIIVYNKIGYLHYKWNTTSFNTNISTNSYIKDALYIYALSEEEYMNCFSHKDPDICAGFLKLYHIKKYMKLINKNYPIYFHRSLFLDDTPINIEILNDYLLKYQSKLDKLYTNFFTECIKKGSYKNTLRKVIKFIKN